MPEAQAIEALNVHSFNSEPGGMGVTGQTTDGIVSIGVTLAGVVPVGVEVLFAFKMDLFDTDFDFASRHTKVYTYNLSKCERVSCNNLLPVPQKKGIILLP